MEEHGPRLHDAYPVRTVARLTGLSADLIRAWEKRYRVVSPIRGPRGARLYTADDVTHLRLLARAVESGRTIGDVAPLGLASLEELVREIQPVTARGRRETILDHVLAAVEQFDAAGVRGHLGEALMALGAGRFVREVVVPLLEEVGARWSDGRLSVADEHLLSGVLRHLLSGLIQSRQDGARPILLLATPAGERHEFGLLAVGLLAVEAGVGVSYLGVDLPAAEIVSAATRSAVAVVGLGVVDSANRQDAVDQLRQVERQTLAQTELWLGGRDAAAAIAALGPSRARVIDSLPLLTREMSRLRDVVLMRG